MSEVLSHSSDDASSKKRRTFRLFRKKNKTEGPKSPTNAGATKPIESPASPLVAKENAPTMSPVPSVPSTSPSLPKKPVQDRLELGKKSWLCQTKFFKDMITSSFDMVDQDGSGSIDEKELYSGLLLIHLKMGTYAGPAACKPISREKCHSVFVKMDSDGSGHLDREEFEAVVMVLFGNVMMRVVIQYACTLLIVPMIAQAILSTITGSIRFVYLLIATMDERNSLANYLELFLEHLWYHAITFWSSKIPSFVYHGMEVVQEWLAVIPDSVWESLPLTLVSTILSCMLVPWSLLQIDDLFQRLAEYSNVKKA